MPGGAGLLEGYVARLDDLFGRLAQRRGRREYLAGVSANCGPLPRSRLTPAPTIQGTPSWLLHAGNAGPSLRGLQKQRPGADAGSLRQMASGIAPRPAAIGDNVPLRGLVILVRHVLEERSASPGDPVVTARGQPPPWAAEEHWSPGIRDRLSSALPMTRRRLLRAGRR